MTDWALVKNRADLWEQMEPHYYYVQQETVDKMAEAKNNWRYHARLVLETGDPGIFRAGDLEAYPDVKEAALNRAVTSMAEAEREKALGAFGMLMKHPDAVDERLTDLRIDAVELFSQMEQAMEEGGDMEELNRQFNAITDEEQRIRFAYSLQNPWVLNFMQLPQKLSHAYVIAAIDHIKIQAAIVDRDWLRSPVYPSAGKYNKGMSAVIGAEAPGTEVDREKDGRKKRRVKNLIYREPELEITGITPIPRYYQYRDYLPEHWLNPETEEEKAEVASAREEAAGWLEKQRGVKPVPCYRKRRKSRSC